jgi:hypothetical protein
MIDMDDFRAFHKVGTLLSFSAAGRVLGVRKSAVSRSIQRLETALHVRVFERTTREVALTEAGRVMLSRPGGRERSPATRAFVSFVRERVVGNPRWFDR